MGSGEQAPHQGSALSAQLAKLAKPGAAAFRIICNNLKQQQCSVRNTMEEVQVNGSYRSVIKVNGDAEENYLFLALLAQLTSVGEITRQQWEERWKELKSSSGYFIVVIEDVALEKVVGAAALLVEKKFIHECGQVGRVEDVVVSNQYRGRQLGKLLVSSCSLLAKRLDCYKVTLNCADKMVKFYNSLGYSCEQGNANYMCIRLDK